MAGPGQVASIGGLMVFGTFGSIFSKLVYQLRGVGRYGDKHYFRKPWATTALMFVGMALCLPLTWIANAYKAWRHPIDHEINEGHQPLLQTLAAQQNESVVADAPKEIKSSFWFLAVPMAFDLIATLLMSIGLLYVTASVYQMLRGAEMLFSAGLSVTFLKRSLTWWHKAGIACCLAGITIVGASSLLSSQSSPSAEPVMVLTGMVLIVAAQFVQAAQVVVEDYAMRDAGVAPLKVVGYEGLFGTLAFIALLPLAQVLPGKDGDGIHEDSIDTWHLVTHSLPAWAIPAALASQAGSLLLYNIAGMFVTDSLGAVTRTVLESMRTLFVWLGDLALYYTVSPKLGEGWDRTSYLQAVGFLILVTGTLVYSKGDRKEEKEQEEARQRLKVPKKAGPVFRQSMTISCMPLRTMSHTRWRKAAALALAAARLEHAGQDYRDRHPHGHGEA